MGGDAAINNADSWLQPTSLHPKIWKDGNIIVGVGGKQRIAQLVHQFKAPAITGDAYEYLRDRYIPGLYLHLCDSFVIKTCDEDGMVCMDATILIGLMGRLFKIDSSFAITEYPEYAAIGANNEVALGALYASDFLNYENSNPTGRIELALYAVLNQCASIREPFTYLEL